MRLLPMLLLRLRLLLLLPLRLRRHLPPNKPAVADDRVLLLPLLLRHLPPKNKLALAGDLAADTCRSIRVEQLAELALLRRCCSIQLALTSASPVASACGRLLVQTAGAGSSRLASPGMASPEWRETHKVNAICEGAAPVHAVRAD